MKSYPNAQLDASLLPAYVKRIMSRLEARGFEAYIVGGCVRDLFRSVRPHDWDICSSARPEELMSVFPRALPTGIKHGTVTVSSGGMRCEVTTFRSDGEYRDHRRPESVVFLSSLEEDLARRDFTMNAIACDIRGQVYDYHGGLSDIRAGLIRCVGDAVKRFDEDALRILRAYRFSAQLGFRLDSELISAARKKAPLCAALSPERVGAELEKLLLSPAPQISAELIASGALERYFGTVCPDAARLKLLPKRLEQRLYALCVLAKVSPAETAKELRLQRKTIADFSKAESINLPCTGIADWKRVIARCGDAAAACLASGRCVLGDAKALKKLRQALECGECCRLSELAFNGSDAEALGFRGKEVGRLLDMLLDYVIQNPEKNDKETLTDLAKQPTYMLT